MSEEHLPESKTVAFQSIILSGLVCISALFLFEGMIGKIIFLLSPVIAIIFGFISYSYMEFQHKTYGKSDESTDE